MARRVICISRLLGAGGDDVGRIVADELGYRLVDEEIVQQAAESNGVTVEELADAEKRTKVIDRLVRNLAMAGGAAGLMSTGTGVVELSGGNDPKSLRALIQRSIHETAERGEVVIVSHAASYALTGRDDVLRVLVTAIARNTGRPCRARRCARQQEGCQSGCPERRCPRRLPEKLLQRRRRVATHYDLALNSDSMSVGLMSDLVIRAASAL